MRVQALKGNSGDHILIDHLLYSTLFRSTCNYEISLQYPVLPLFLLTVHGKSIDPSQAKWHKQYEKQKNAPDPAEMLLNTDPEPDLKKGFVDLFNGKDLRGWTPRGGKCKFEVEDGSIVGTCVPGSPSTYLSTNKEYGDFIFTCDMKWLINSNSGIMFRAKSKGRTTYSARRRKWRIRAGVGPAVSMVRVAAVSGIPCG